MQRLAGVLLATTALVPLAVLPVQSNPLDADIIAGAVTVEGTANLAVNQASEKAIIDWRTSRLVL